MIDKHKNINIKKIEFNAADYFGCGFYRMMIPCENLPKEYETTFKIKDKRYALDYSKDVDVTVTQWNIDEFDLKEYKKLKSLKVLDLDDFLHGKVIITDKSIEYNKQQLNIIDEFIRASDIITVSTEPLKEKYLPKNKNIVVLPNQIDFRVFNKEYSYVRKESQKDKIVIGWAGSYTHFVDLQLSILAIEQIMKENDNVIFAMIGWDGKAHISINGKIREFNVLANIPVERTIIMDWTNDFKLHANRLSLFDIGIAPLIDNEFNKCKSNIKYLELAAMGIPAICSNVYPYANTIGYKPILAKSKGNIFASWYSKLNMLVKDKEMRKEISELQYNSVVENYDIKKNINLWENVYNK